MWKYISNIITGYPESLIYSSDSEQTTYTYSEVLEKAKAHGDKLSKVIKPGNKCAIMCISEFNTAIAILAAWCAGLIPIPLSKNYGEQHCRSILDLCQPQVIICDDAGEQYDYPNASIYNFAYSCFANTIDNNTSERELSDIALIMCTSGTTGRPKGILLTKEGLINNIAGICRYFLITNEDTILIVRPLYHSAVMTGEFLTSLVKGTNIVFCDQQYSPNKVVEYINKYNVSVMCATPTLYRHLSQILAMSNENVNIKSIVMSGECLTNNTAHTVRKSFPHSKIYNVYGLTEASPRVSYLPPEQFDSHPGSVGIPLSDTEIKIISQEGALCSHNQHGMIYVKSNSLMKGYYHNQELTDKVLVNGWLRTGDIGYKDNEGYLYIMSRSDYMIIKGGMNIYPQEIEIIIQKLDQVDECMAYAINRGDLCSIGLDVVINKEYYPEVTVKNLKESIADILPKYLLPSIVHIVDKLPKNASGKILWPKYDYRK